MFDKMHRIKEINRCQTDNFFNITYMCELIDRNTFLSNEVQNKADINTFKCSPVQIKNTRRKESRNDMYELVLGLKKKKEKKTRRAEEFLCLISNSHKKKTKNEENTAEANYITYELRPFMASAFLPRTACLARRTTGIFVYLNFFASCTNLPPMDCEKW